MESNSKLIIGIMAAAAAGVAAGILLAPSSGSELRQKVMNSFDELRDKVNEFIESAQQRATEIADEFHRDVEHLEEDARQTAAHAKKIVS